MFLGSSEQSSDLFGDVQRAVFPHRVFALLDPRGWYCRYVNGFGLFRSKTEDDWREVIYRLAGLSKIVVIDLRFPTGAVVEELKMLIQAKRQYKVIGVASPSGKCPVIKQLRKRETMQDADMSDLFVTVDGEMKGALKNLLQSRVRLPSESQPLTFIFQ